MFFSVHWDLWKSMNQATNQPPQGPVGAAIRYARRLIILVLGGTVLLIGVVMIFTPGPALVVIPLGLAILGLEFAWARRLLRRVRTGIENGLGRKANAPELKTGLGPDAGRTCARPSSSPGSRE